MNNRENDNVTRIFQENWEELQNKIKEKWSKLSANDIEKINGAYDTLATRLKKLYGYDVEELEVAINEFLAKEGYGDLSSRAAALWHGAVAVKDRVKDSVQESTAQTKEKIDDIHQAVSGYVKANPLKSVGIAMVVGAVVGKLFKR